MTMQPKTNHPIAKTFLKLAFYDIYNLLDKHNMVHSLLWDLL